MRTALRSSVAKNAASLYAIQFANYILPLITVPYLVRVLGPAGFGVVAFGQSLIAYFVLFVDYGFALSATRKISVNRNDSAKLSQIVFRIWAAKALLCVVGLATLLFLIMIVPKVREVALLSFILYGTVVGSVLFPAWLFQGMERMVAISVINLVLRLIVVIGIFTMIHRPEDYLLYAGLTSLGAVGSGLVGVGVAFYMFKLHPAIPSWRGIWEELVEGWMLFLSMASVSLYTVGNAFILGLLTNHTVVGYYTAAEKIVKAVLGLLGPVSQAAYPRFSKMASESKTLALQWAERMLFLMGGLGFIFSMAIFVGAPVLVRTILGLEYEASITVMRILAALPLLISLSNVLGVQVMYSFGMERAVTAIVFTAGLLNLALAVVFVPMWIAEGMALAVVATEAFVTIGFLVYLQRNHLSPVIIKSLLKDNITMKSLLQLLPRPVKNILRLVILFFKTVKFLAKYKFLPPPDGTDLSGYEKLIEVFENRRLAEVEGDVVEVGAFLGGGTYKLAKYLERKRIHKIVYAIDIFDSTFDKSKCTQGIEMADLYIQAINRVGRGRLSQWDIFQLMTKNCKNIQVIKGDTKKIKLRISKICFAFVDGNHDPSYVRNDFYLIWSKLSHKGVIAFDDYGYDLPQVTSTINELIDRHAQELTVIGRKDKIIFIQKL